MGQPEEANRRLAPMLHRGVHMAGLIAISKAPAGYLTRDSGWRPAALGQKRGVRSEVPCSKRATYMQLPVRRGRDALRWRSAFPSKLPAAAFRTELTAKQS